MKIVEYIYYNFKFKKMIAEKHKPFLFALNCYFYIPCVCLEW